LAISGLLYNAASLYGVASGAIDKLTVENSTPYVHAAFYVMSAICVLFYAVLFLCGVQFVRLRSAIWWLFAVVLAAEVLFYFGVGWLWSHPTLGGSIAAATGISGGGLVLQFVVLFPLWAPIVVWLAHRSTIARAP
jgi:hypothetical protein